MIPRAEATDPEDSFTYQHVCGTCFGLYESGRPDDLEQRCACQPQWAERWPRFDFNTRAELCRCCGTEAVHSGSRWSPYFCRTCQQMAIGVSIWQRRLVFPIGRHTIMNNFVPDSVASTLAARHRCSRELAETVLSAIRVMSTGSDGLERWARIVVARNLERCGLPAGVLLSEYLIAVKSTDGLSRSAAFADLCEFFKSLPPVAGCRGIH